LHRSLLRSWTPPYLVDHDAGVQLASTPAIVRYVSMKFGLMPDAIDKQALALKAMLDCNDVLAEISLGNGAQMWDANTWAEFSGTRLVRWLQIFEQTGAIHGLSPDAGFLLGTPKATMADLG